MGATVGSSGNLIFADSNNNRIGVIAAATGTSYGQAMTAGHVYTIAGTGQAGFSGDGSPATRARLSTFYSAGVASGGSGNILIVDGGNSRIRMIAEKSGDFYGQKMTIGHIYTIAGSQGGDSGDGGPATKARLGQPRSLAIDQSGNVIIADSSSADKVRVIAAVSGVFYGIPMTAGDIYTVAGDGTEGYSGDSGPAARAEISLISVALDPAGNLLIGGWGTIREVAK